MSLIGMLTFLFEVVMIIVVGTIILVAIALFDTMREDGSEYTSVQGMRGEFAEARNLVVDERDVAADSGEYTADETGEWMREQQRFFYETLGTVLYFLTDSSRDDGAVGAARCHRCIIGSDGIRRPGDVRARSRRRPNGRGILSV